MTLHVPCDHACAGCGALFIPYAEGAACPKCGRAADRFVDFIPQAAASLRRNLGAEGGYLPRAWYVGSLGDHVLKLLFIVFEGFRTSAGAAPFEAYLDRKLGAMNWGDQPYLRDHVRDIARRVRAAMGGES